MSLLIRKKELRVSGISIETKLSTRAISKHLNILAGADILEKDQRGTEM